MSENVGNDAKSTLNTGVDDTITSWVVDNPLTGPAYPAVNFRVRLGTAATGELVLVTAATDNGNGTSNWTVQRGVEGTANQAWIAGTVIEHVLTAAALSLIATQIAAAAVAAAPVSGLVDYYLNTPPPVHITGYENLGRQPGIGSIVDESVACIGGGSNTWGTPVLIDKYATRIGDPGEAAHIVGSWEFFFFGYASSVTKDVRLVYEVYRRTAAGVESLIFTKNSSFILSTSAVAPTALADIYVQSASVLFASDDTITLYVYAQTNSNSSVTVHYFHNDGAYASYVQTPMTTSVPHPQYINVTQTAHGFSNGQAIYFTGAAWALADASNAGKLAICLVGDKTTDTFNAYYAGPITIAAGAYTPGHFYFVDPATPGALTTTDPLTSGTVGQFSNPIFHALGATYGFVLPYRPAAVQASLWPGTSASLIAGDGSNVASARTKLDEVAATTITSLTAATTTAYGTSKLSVAPASATAPIAVGTNDTRMSDARVASSVSESVLRTSAAGLTAALAVNSQKITGLANGSAATDAAAYGQLTGWNGYGAFASKPAASTAGRRYTCSDGPGDLIDSGSAWLVVTPNLPPQPIPLVALFTGWVNQGAATLTQVGASLQLSTPSSAAGWRKIVYSAPGTPYTIIVQVVPQILWASDAAVHQYALGWRDSGTGNSELLHIYRNTTALTWGVTGYNSSDTFVADRVTATTVSISTQPMLFRLGDTGTNRTIETSVDGSTWETMYSGVRTTGTANPNQLCAAVSYASGAAGPCTLSIRSWG